MPEKSPELLQLIEEARKQPNYRIEYGCRRPPKDGSKYAAIYFSSDAVYFPDTPEAFRTKIIKRDNYEWFTTRFSFAEKHIFVRDLRKCSFFDGPNREINNILKLADFLRKETEGYRIVTIGSSLGGMMSSLIGSMLDVAYAFNFCGAFILPEFDRWLDRSCGRNPGITEDLRLVYNAHPNVPIFYMTSTESPFDINQMSFAHTVPSVKVAAIISKTHGVPVFKNVLKRLMEMPPEELNKIYVHAPEQPVTEYEFIRRHWGITVILERQFSILKRHPGKLFSKDFWRFFTGK